MLNRPLQAQRGVTIIELAVTLTVLGLLLAATAPSASDWLRNLQIRNAAQTIHSGMQRARTEAIRRNQNVTFSLVALTDVRIMNNSCTLSSSGRSWVVSLQSPQTKCGVTDAAATPMIIETYAGGDGNTDVVVAAKDASDAAASQVTFNGFGEVVSTGSPIFKVLVDNSVSGTRFRKLQVSLSRAGNVRMCDPLATGTDPRTC